MSIRQTFAAVLAIPAIPAISATDRNLAVLASRAFLTVIRYHLFAL
jgi:hypothetical protein